MLSTQGTPVSTATVIIPTTGSTCLDSAISSVVNQTHKDTQCWVVIDGPEFAANTREITKRYPSVRVLELAENTGANNFYGHRIYAATGFLINTDYILYLDQDNWFDPDHVANMIAHLDKTGDDWCHSLRKIHDKNGNYLTDDNCESLGKWPAWVGENVHLVDTSCYCIKREVITRISQAWYAGWGGDRIFLANIAHHFAKWSCTGKYSLNYRLDGNPGSVNAEFFTQGNKLMSDQYPAGYPWSDIK